MENSDSLTPDIVQRIAAICAQLGELIDIVNTDEMKQILSKISGMSESLDQLLESLKLLTETGTLETLVELSNFVEAIKQSVTPSLVANTLSQGVSLIATGTQILDTIEESVNEARQDKREIGIIGLARELKDPQVQQSLKILLAFAHKIPKLVS